MTMHGTSIIAGEHVPGTAGSVRAVNPTTGCELEPSYGYIGRREAEQAALAAANAFDQYRATTPEHRARFLERIADHLDELKELIIQRAALETGLTPERLRGEQARTVGQLRAFADEVRLGAHQGVRIDDPEPRRAPAPKPDLRQRQIPLGPVLVFGASNFPLAFSTAGGDTAAALAAGCPVIVKAHNAHAGTAELAGQAIVAATRDLELPPGVFSLVYGPGNTIGQHLAAHPEIKAIAFTGSRAGGTALMATAARRPEPIPVFAEMSSINPVIILPGALRKDAASLAKGFVASLTLGAGQFCTNPGLVLIPGESGSFVREVVSLIAATTGQTMLTTGICSAYRDGVARLERAGAQVLSTGTDEAHRNAPSPTVLSMNTADLRQNPELQDEVFGAAAVLVTYRDECDLVATLSELQGQLTITVHATAADNSTVAQLLPILEGKAGRLIANGWPTGVEVSHAMVHGGPFPATSNSQGTSVGTLAIHRFQRPVCYQGFDDALLPPAVQQANPWGLPRRINGSLTLINQEPSLA